MNADTLVTAVLAEQKLREALHHVDLWRMESRLPFTQAANRNNLALKKYTQMKYRDLRKAATGNQISVYATQLHQETKYQHAMQRNFCFANIKETYLRAKDHRFTIYNTKRASLPGFKPLRMCVSSWLCQMMFR
jgi:hypothetical protein